MTRTSIAGIAVGALAVGLVVAGTASAVTGPDDTRIVTPVSVNAADAATIDDQITDPTTDPTTDPSADPSGSPSATAPLRGSDDDDSDDDSDDHSDDHSGSAVAVPAGVTLDRARAIALGAVDGTIRETELDDEDGRTVWEVELTGTDRAKWEVTIDAVTGKILETERY